MFCKVCGAAFINVGEGKNTFIHLKDILPKNNIKKDLSVKEEKNIKELIKPGDNILVQVKRAESNKKGARVSTHISLTGKYTVLMPDAEFITISQKIDNEEEKKRLTKVFEKIITKGYGAIIRTSAEGKSKEELAEDVRILFERWNKILVSSKEGKPTPRILYKSDGIIKRMLVDLSNKQVGSIIVNSKNGYDEVAEIARQIEKNTIKIEIKDDILEMYELEKQKDKIENRKIWLRCGGFITIDKTEALIAIDVNSGKYIGTKSLEQTIYTVNREATLEIVKQLRLRDLGGIIIIDYIDMKENENRKKIEELLKEELKKDRSKTQVLGFTNLNLLEMTRKHIYG